MQFSTVVSVAAVAAVANAQYNSTVTATATENQTTLVTITDCENHICHETVSPAIVSTATVTENNIVTKYTTWCPISNAEKPTATVEKPTAEKPTAEKPTAEKPTATAEKPATTKPANPVHPTATAEKPAPTAEKPTTVVQATKKQESTIKVSSYTGAAAQVLPAAGALIAGAAALLL